MSYDISTDDLFSPNVRTNRLVKLELKKNLSALFKNFEFLKTRIVNYCNFTCRCIVKDPQRALEHLNKVRVAAEGKLWNASKILGVKQQSLYRESCTLLHKALLNMTRDVRDEDPELSIRAAMFSLNRATDCSYCDKY